MRSHGTATAAGLFLLVAAVYSLASPGRIDMIDGQYRFEVARNIVRNRSTQVRDPFLTAAAPGLTGRYAPYGLSGSVVGVPLILLARVTGRPTLNREQFFFAFTSPLFGAATAALLFAFY